MKRIISSRVVQAFLIYVSGGWIVLEMTDYIVNKYELNEKISDVLPLILLIGMPVAVFLAWYLGREKEEINERPGGTVSERKTAGLIRAMRMKPWFSVPGSVILILLIVTLIRSIHRQAKIEWASGQALPQMQYLLDDLDYVEAFQLHQQVKKYIQDNPEFKKLEPRISRRFTVLSEPEGADVFYKKYRDADDKWTLLGTTPLENIEMPNRTLYSWRLEKKGYETVFAAAPTHMDTLFRTLHETGTIPGGMVYVDGIARQSGFGFLSRENNGFFIDRYEVSNRMYKAFMDQGGYQNREFWQNEFILDNDTLTFDQAMEHFTDITDRPGPATWEAGDYPDGQDDYPVNGISWYEAAAYAAYAEKSLPTYIHWQSAAGFLFSPSPQLYSPNVVPLSNMNGSGPEPVSRPEGMNYFGTYNMAGNVREWCWNKSPDGNIILGGAWNDAGYLSISMSQMPSFNRSPKNGFRCVVLPDKERFPEQNFQPVSYLGDNQDYRFIEPATETEFQIYKKQFQYDRMAMNSQLEERDESHEDWIMEKISFDAAYENERMTAYLFLPKEAEAPFQTIIFFPGAYAATQTSFLESNIINRYIDYLMKNGRAVMCPIYKTTYERSSEIYNCANSSETHQYTECMVKVTKDLSRSIDYLETREDIDMSRLGYLGDSWGGRMGAIIPAVENRLKLCVLTRGGLSQIKKYPEATESNYVSQVTVPVLMLNGRYDYTFPYESTVLPMFDLLGTPEQDKKLVTFETEHFIPKSETVKETLAWLDRYFGPVKK